MSRRRPVCLHPMLQGVWGVIGDKAADRRSQFSFCPHREKMSQWGDTAAFSLCHWRGVTGTEWASKKMSQLVYRNIGRSVSCYALLVRVCEQEPNLELSFPFELVTLDKIPHAFPFRQISSQLQSLPLELKIYNHWFDLIIWYIPFFARWELDVWTEADPWSSDIQFLF